MDNDIRLIAIGDVDRLPDVRARAARRADARLGRQPVDDAVPGAVVRRARVDRRRRRARCASWRRAGRSARGDHRGAVRRRRCRPAACPSSTCWSAPRARSGCRTSCSGRRPTPSCTSRTPSGRTSARRSCTRRWSRTAGASAASAAPASRSAAPAERAGGAAMAACREPRPARPALGGSWRCPWWRLLILWREPLGFGALVLVVAALALHEYAGHHPATRRAAAAARRRDRAGRRRWRPALYLRAGPGHRLGPGGVHRHGGAGAARPGRHPGRRRAAGHRRRSASSTWACCRAPLALLHRDAPHGPAVGAARHRA